MSEALYIHYRHFHLLDCRLLLVLYRHLMEEVRQLHTLFLYHRILPIKRVNYLYISRFVIVEIILESLIQMCHHLIQE